MSPLSSAGLFFACSLVFTALFQAPWISVMREGGTPSGGLTLLLALGSCGPTLVALVLSAIANGRAGVRALFARRGRPAWYFYVVALLHVAAAHLVGTLALIVVGRHVPQHWLYPPLLPEQIAIAVLAPLGEEYGWRGYALPRLQSAMKPLAASLVIGVVWTLWHLPTAFMPGDSIAHVLVTMPAMLAGSVLYTWMYNATGGSMRIVLLAHLGVHLDNVFRAASTADGPAPFVATSIVLVAFAVLVAGSGALRGGAVVTAEPARAPA
jgi:membrane protease YdiL (CAAX protease family)